ncbi:DUF6776 family protein [Aliagarivorans taiwanensis]|uniref:DUF6776 family protein n=1 Tax=Aliagarivorans taiwanensis TaxID=561966 RepID=UPI000406AE50|nr:DUF6776 family protein [Aliagarivorans taiwanensis]
MYPLKRLSLLIVTFVVSLALFIVWLAHNLNMEQQHQLGEVERASELAHQQALELQQQLKLTEQALVIGQAEVEQLQQVLRQSEELNAELQEELSLYRRIMAPEQSAGGAVIERFQLQKQLSEGYYRMQVLLIQVAHKKRWLDGDVDLLISGSEQGEPREYRLSDLRDSGSLPSFKFRYFQELSSNFKLPQGFLPEQVQVVVSFKADNASKVNRLTLNQEWQPLAIADDYPVAGIELLPTPELVSQEAQEEAGEAALQQSELTEAEAPSVSEAAVQAEAQLAQGEQLDQVEKATTVELIESDGEASQTAPSATRLVAPQGQGSGANTTDSPRNTMQLDSN